MNGLRQSLTAALIAAVAFGGLGYSWGWRHATTKADLAMEKHLAADRQAELDQKDRVRKLERDLADAQASASEWYERGKKDAEAAAAAVAADLRAGTLQLRQRWAGCETERLSQTAALTAELDAAARDREESAARIVRAAAECDAQVLGLQRLLLDERKHLNQPNPD